MSSVMETESLSDTKVGMLQQLSGIMETENMVEVAQKYIPNCTLLFFRVSQ